LAQYYYLVASLPLLFYETESVPSRETFLQTCSQHLRPSHYRLLRSTAAEYLVTDKTGCKTLDLWRQWEIALRNELVRLRTKNRDLEAQSHLVESPTVLSAQQSAHEAFGQESPLQAEDALNRARWRYLDELEVGHYFDIDKILIYDLRLQILERKALFDAEQGREMFEKIYAEILDPVGVS
jgi:hypothetical protein